MRLDWRTIPQSRQAVPAPFAQGSLEKTCCIQLSLTIPRLIASLVQREVLSASEAEGLLQSIPFMLKQRLLKSIPMHKSGGIVTKHPFAAKQRLLQSILLRQSRDCYKASYYDKAETVAKHPIAIKQGSLQIIKHSAFNFQFPIHSVVFVLST